MIYVAPTCGKNQVAFVAGSLAVVKAVSLTLRLIPVSHLCGSSRSSTTIENRRILKRLKEPY